MPPASAAGRDVPNEQVLQRLVRDAHAGDAAAFEEIVYLHRDQVYGIAWQMTRNADDAMDVTQEVFVRVFRALGSFRGRARFATWLHRIVLNCAMDYLRHERRHRSGKVDLDEDFGAEPGDDTHRRRLEPSVPGSQRDTAGAHELQRRVLAALAQLSARQRQVFILRYYHELGLNEVAEIMRTSPGTVKRHLFRAQARLKELLKDLRPR